VTDSFEAVIFDMDGTLIEQMLDFEAIRVELGISPQDGILEAISEMSAEAAGIAGAKLLEHELSAARNARLLPSAIEVVSAISEAGLPTALLTRNARQVMETVLAKFGLKFDLAWSRENGPIKPEPDGILRACEQLGVRPERTCCVGDFQYDVTAANAAGAVSVLLVSDGRDRDFAHEADHVITRLDELPEILGI